MTCAQIQVLIGVYPELDAPTRRLLDQHVRGCPACAAAWHDEAAFHRLMTERRDPLPHPGLEARLLAVAGRGAARPSVRDGHAARHHSPATGMLGRFRGAFSARGGVLGIAMATLGIAAWRLAVPGPAPSPDGARAPRDWPALPTSAITTEPGIARVWMPPLAPRETPVVAAAIDPASADGVGGTGVSRRIDAAARGRMAGLPHAPAPPAAPPTAPMMMPIGPTTTPVPPTPPADQANRATPGASRPPKAPPPTAPSSTAPPAAAASSTPTPPATAMARRLTVQIAADDPHLALDGQSAAVLVELADGDGWHPVYEEVLVFAAGLAEGHAALAAPPPYAVELVAAPAPAALCAGEARRRILTAADVDAAQGVVRFRLCPAAPAPTPTPDAMSTVTGPAGPAPTAGAAAEGVAGTRAPAAGATTGTRR